MFLFSPVHNNYTILEAAIQIEVVKYSYANDLDHIFVIQCLYYCLPNVFFCNICAGKK
jgi:hypothetical protein